MVGRVVDGVVGSVRARTDEVMDRLIGRASEELERLTG